MSLTINVPEWFGWIGVTFAIFWVVGFCYDAYWQHQERKQYKATH